MVKFSYDEDTCPICGEGKIILQGGCTVCSKGCGYTGSCSN